MVTLLSSLLPPIGARASDPLPAERSALILYKSLPYNQSWEGLETIEIVVVAPMGEDAARAEEYARMLHEIAAQAKRQDSSALDVDATATALESLGADLSTDTAPQLVFLLAGSDPPDDGLLDGVRDLAIRRSILLATDQESLLDEYAALGFLLSADHRPQIVIDLERARLQGAHFVAGFVRLARTRESGR